MNAGPGLEEVVSKDLLNLVYLCKYYGLKEVANYWEQVILLNEWQKTKISKLIVDTFRDRNFKKIVILGFAFKSNTDDTGLSAISIVNDLMENGANLIIHDSQVSENQINAALNEEKSIKNSFEGTWQFLKI